MGSTASILSLQISLFAVSSVIPPPSWMASTNRTGWSEASGVGTSRGQKSRSRHTNTAKLTRESRSLTKKIKNPKCLHIFRVRSGKRFAQCRYTSPDNATFWFHTGNPFLHMPGGVEPLTVINIAPRESIIFNGFA